MAEARFLAAADLHLGRPIASLPEALRERSGELGPYGALERLVELARRERVDALLLAGDVVDDDGAYFEVFSALQNAVEKLDGLPVLAIAGNHDAHVLPKLAASIDGLTLMGNAGTWESKAVSTAVGDIEILGWGFPDSHHTASPFDTPPPTSTQRRIGLLHGDADTPRSVYAPFTAAHLREHAADAWLIGHVHNPSHARLAGDRPSGYLGSLCGLDPSETGPRGAWLVRCDGRGVSLEHRPLAPIGWAGVTIECDGLDAESIDTTARERAERAAAQFESARAVGVRVVLAGEHDAWRDINARAATIEPGHPWQHQGRAVFIEKIEGQVTPPLHLERLAGERSAAGRIASLILELRAGDAGELVERADEAFSSIAGRHNFRPPEMGEIALPPPEARPTLEREARAMLGALLAQRAEGGG